jgi:hypothetical protein
MQLTVATVFGHSRTMVAGAVFHASVTTWSILADGADSTDTVKVALIGALALVFAAAVPALIGLLRKEKESPVVADLRRARDDWKRTAEAAIRGTEVRDREIRRLDNDNERLQALVVELGGNPFPHVVLEPPEGHS